MLTEISFLTPENADQFFNKMHSLAQKETPFPEAAIQYFDAMWSRDTIAEALRVGRHLFLTAWQDDEMVGILLGTSPEGGVGTVVWILIEPQCRGYGIGSQLLEEACTYYRRLGCHKMKLTIPKKDLLGFYEKWGMVLEGFHPNHWWNMDIWSLGRQL